MEKIGVKTRDIKIYSEKNKGIVIVHSKTAKEFLLWLEDQDWVESYECSCPLQREKLAQVPTVDIRSKFFEQDWASDFLIHCSDGSLAVREITSKDQLQRHSHVVKLELSRRYWKALGIQDWKLVLPAQEY